MLTKEQMNNILATSLLLGCVAAIAPITAPPATSFLIAFGASALVLSMLTKMTNIFSSENSYGSVFRGFGLHWPSYRSRLRVLRPEYRPAQNVYHDAHVRRGAHPHVRRTTAAGTPIPSDAQNVKRVVEVGGTSSRSPSTTRKTATGTSIPSDASNVRRTVTKDGPRSRRHLPTQTRRHGESYMGPNVVVRERRTAPVVFSTTTPGAQNAPTTPSSNPNHSYLSSNRVVKRP